MTEINKEARYTLAGLSQKQAFVLADALELVARLSMGQLEYLMEFVRFGGMTDDTGQPIAYAKLRAGDDLVEELKRALTGYEIGASKGIGNPHTPKDGQIAWELRKAIRHRLAWDRKPEGSPMGVDFDDPNLLTYSTEPRVTLSQPAREATLLERLPPGCFLGQRGTTWTVAQPADGAWTVIAESSIAETAVTKARAALGLSND